MYKVIAQFMYALILGILSSQVLADDQLWEKLASEPNLIVFMRHAHSKGGKPLIWDASGNCRNESRLSYDGEAQARKIRDAFASRGIKPTIISSPMCRCLDTAKIAFDGKPITDPDLRETASADTERLQAFEAKAQTLIAGNRGTDPVVFISHRPNIDQLTMELIAEGDLLVGRIDESGEVEILGKIKEGSY